MPAPLPAPHVPLGFPSLATTGGQTVCPDGPTAPRTVATGQTASPGGPITLYAAAPPTSRATPMPMTTAAPPTAPEPYPRRPQTPPSSASSRSAPMTSATPNAEPSTPPMPRATPVFMTTAAPPMAPEACLCHPQATQEPPSPPLHQQSPPAKAVQVASPVNPHPMIMRAKWCFRLSADKLTLSSTLASIVSPVPSFIRTTLVDPNSRGAMEEEFAALIANNT
jgi:hypothetical protein